MAESRKQTVLTKWNASLERVGKARDGILVIGGALYIVGYVVWSINAYLKGLGLLPAFESQYFIAGIVPLLILFLAYRLIKFSWSRKLPLPSWLNIWESGKLWESFAKMLPLLIFLATSTFRGDIKKYLAGRASLVGWIVAGIAGLIVILAIFSIDFSQPKDALKLPDAARESPFKKWGGRILVGARLLIIVGAGAAALYFYVGLLYSKLPQSLGGVRPRCAYLDVEKKAVSPSTLDAISSASMASSSPLAPTVNPVTGVPSSEPEIVRSNQLEVLFSGSDYLIIRVRAGVYEIKKDVIHAVQSCE